MTDDDFDAEYDRMSAERDAIYGPPRSSEEGRAIACWCADTCGLQIIFMSTGHLMLSGLPAVDYWKTV